MKRRAFLKTSAGLAAISLQPGIFSIPFERMEVKKFNFKTYRPGKTLGKVMQVTPDDGFYIHTFYDVCPFSPSQRYLSVTKLPFQDHLHQYGDLAEVCVIDLQENTIETVFKTRGWDFQLGANLNWGASDRYLYTNDIIDNEAVCVQIDLQTKVVKAFSGPMYHLAPDASAAIGFPLDLINITQSGYGVPRFRSVDKMNGVPADQGIWKTDLSINRKELLVSLKEAYEAAEDRDYLQGGNCYFFHSKYNPQGDKIIQVMRCLFKNNPQKKGWNPMLFTFNNDGSNLHQSVKREYWGYGGNHPNWHPDGEHIIMNLTPVWMGDEKRRFVKFHHQGKDFEILTTKYLGSGHPSVTSDEKYLVSDCYVHEPMALENGEVPIRLLDLVADQEEAICYVFTDLDIDNSVLRVDPHPAWSRDYRKVCFNGAPGGKRAVFVADLSDVI